MISSISGYASTYAPAQQAAAQVRNSRPDETSQKLFGKLDADSSGGISQSELGDFLSYAASAPLSPKQTTAVPPPRQTTVTPEAELPDSATAPPISNDTNSPLQFGLSTLFHALREQLAGGAQASPLQSTQLSTTQLPGEQIFSSIDANGDGSVDPGEFGEFLSANAVQPQTEESGGGGFLKRAEALVDAYRNNAETSDPTTTVASLSVAA